MVLLPEAKHLGKWGVVSVISNLSDEIATLSTWSFAGHDRFGANARTSGA